MAYNILSPRWLQDICNWVEFLNVLLESNQITVKSKHIVNSFILDLIVMRTTLR